MGIHKWEPEIYIEFSPALHLQFLPKSAKARAFSQKHSSSQYTQCGNVQSTWFYTSSIQSTCLELAHAFQTVRALLCRATATVILSRRTETEITKDKNS
jgi:hypothetical protein